jgi:hypothetical protein
MHSSKKTSTEYEGTQKQELSSRLVNCDRLLSLSLNALAIDPSEVRVKAFLHIFYAPSRDISPFF